MMEAFVLGIKKGSIKLACDHSMAVINNYCDYLLI